MYRLFRLVHLAVHDACARRHALHIVLFEGRAPAHAVAMRQLTVDDVGKDLHVAMRMHAEALAGADPVFVDDPQVTESHMPRIVVIRKGKAEFGVEPAMVRVAPFF